MAYSKGRLLNALVGLSMHTERWIWDGLDGKSNLDRLKEKHRLKLDARQSASMRAAMALSRRKHPHIGNVLATEDDKESFISELLDYCWCVYRKANVASGRQYIGRIADLDDYRARVARLDPEKGHTLFMSTGNGNLLVLLPRCCSFYLCR